MVDIDLTAGLDPAQCEAVEHGPGPLVVAAVAVSARPDRLTGQDATVEAKLRNVAGRVSRLLHGAHPR